MSANKRPNFLFILADDLGFSDIGCYGGEIETPNIDALASEGVRMLNHHTAAACSPTRAMIMSGTDAHLGGLGVLIEYKMNEKGKKRYNGKAGYEGFLNEDIAALPEILADNGYFTAMSGKWHLGMRTEQGPWNRGFKKAFAMLPGCCNHYGWEPFQEQFPVGGRPVHAESGRKADVPANTTEDPNGFYSTDTYTARLISYLADRTDEERTHPFFGFLPFTAPHWPLQCSKASRDKYKGVYDQGPSALRKRRLEKLVELGIISADVVPHEMVDLGTVQWDDMSEAERKISSRTMETYAGMVDSIDHNVGKVVDFLKQTGEYDNTFIVFMSDNGAEGAAFEAIPTMSESIMETIAKYYDNGIENIGNWNSYTWTGPSWAQASTAPSRLFKCWPSEGGILVPCVVKPPKDTFRQEISEGGLNRSFTTCMDYAPTFLDLAGISSDLAVNKAYSGHLNGSRHDELDSRFDSPTESRSSKTVNKAVKTATHRGRPVYPYRGRSWVPYLARGEMAEQDEAFAIYPSDDIVGWELFARAALRKGDWKIVHIPQEVGGNGVGDEGWELFNIRQDPGETSDVSEEQPEKFKELLGHWEDYVVEYGIVWGEKAMCDGVDFDEEPYWHEDDHKLQQVWVGTQADQEPNFESLGVPRVGRQSD